jgi:hypothetical protein
MIPGFFQGTEMPTEGWWGTLWPDPACVLTSLGLKPHDNPETIAGGDVDVALGDIAKLKNLFECQRCGRNVKAKNVVPGQNKISCKCGKKEVEWK